MNKLQSYISDLYSPEIWQALQPYLDDIKEGNIGRRKLAKKLDDISVKQARNIISKVRNSDEIPEKTIDHTKKIGHWVTEEEYVYNGEDDRYVFMIHEYDKNLVFPGKKIRKLCRMYSNYNNGATINECAKRLELPRDIIKGILRALGFTHDREPFTPEEIQSKNVDELIGQHLQHKRMEFDRKLNKKQWKITQKKAEKYDYFKNSTLDAVSDWLSDITVKTDTAKVEAPNLSIAKFPEQGAFLAGYDLHYGKRAVSMLSGQDWNMKTAEKVILEKYDQQLSKLPFYNIEKIYTIVGSDFLQVDTAKGTTTKGTHVAIDGSPQEVVYGGIDLQYKIIDKIRKVAPVELICNPGNHDKLLTIAMYAAMKNAFKGCDDVIMKDDIKDVQFRSYGNNAMMIIHGDQLNKSKSKTLPNIISQQMPGYKHKAIFSGHKHHELTADLNGAMLYQCPTLTARDDWEFNNLYIGGRRAIASFVIDPDKGVTNYILETQ